MLLRKHFGQQRFSSTEQKHRGLHIVGHERKNHVAIKAASPVELQNKRRKENPAPCWLFPISHTVIVFSNEQTIQPQ